jgi:hypothetical protein
MGGFWGRPGVKAQSGRTKEETEASARAILGWPQPPKQADPESESEDNRMRREANEAHKHARNPISEQTRNESLARLLGDDVVDWYREL